MTIVHIASPVEWEAARASGMYRVDSLVSEGFIHLSRWDQLADTAARYYAGVPDLLVLVVDPAGLPVRLENGYPHLYGDLPVEAVEEVLPLEEALRRAAG